MKHNAKAIKKIDELDVEFTHAIATYKKWRFKITPIPSVTPSGEYEISVKHDKLEGDVILQKRNVGYVAPSPIKSMKEAIEIIQDFISTELA